MDNVIHQFMWQWQPHFRINVQVLADMSLEKIGARLDPQVVLVGIADDSGAHYPICIEPETGQLQPEHLVGIKRPGIAALRGGSGTSDVAFGS